MGHGQGLTTQDACCAACRLHWDDNALDGGGPARQRVNLCGSCSAAPPSDERRPPRRRAEPVWRAVVASKHCVAPQRDCHEMHQAANQAMPSLQWCD